MLSLHEDGPRLRGQRVAVVGLGKSGLSAVELLLREGAQVAAVDDRTEESLGADARALRAQGVTLLLGGLERAGAFWSGQDAVVVSPGVPLAHPVCARARDEGACLIGEVELAGRLLAAGHGPLVGITGTNGKSTTTALTGTLLEAAGFDTFVGGNLGRPFTEACERAYQRYVVELSSFQLEGTQRARFNGAAVLNLTPDHLDRYASHAEYGRAKARIFQSQDAGDFAVVNADDAEVLELARAAKVPVYGFSMTGRPVASRPALAGLAVATPEGGFTLDFQDGERFSVGNRALRGAHNLMNAMAATLLARLSGGAPEALQRGLDTYPGLAHRLESVRVLDGVEWINDSKATNVDSSLVALKALPGRLWLIAGGKGKGAPYQPMVEASQGKVLGVLTVGQDAPALEAAYRGFQVIACQDLQTAVKKARDLAKSGDIVLLSPACASYDQFRNFEHRGESFKRMVQEL